MKTMTGLLVGAAMLVSASASAQYYAQASVTGEVLSYGPRGFMLQGPDGNYGIEVGPSTVVTDPWNSFVVTGQGNVQAGDYVTATGFPTSQWIMRATQVTVRNAPPPVVYPPYNDGYGGYVTPPVGVIQTPTIIAPYQGSNVNGNPSPASIAPSPITTSMINLLNPFSLISGRR